MAGDHGTCGQVSGHVSLLPVQAAVLAGVRVRPAQFGATQQSHGVLMVQRVQRVTAGNRRSEVRERRQSESESERGTRKMKPF